MVEGCYLDWSSAKLGISIDTRFSEFPFGDNLVKLLNYPWKVFILVFINSNPEVYSSSKPLRAFTRYGLKREMYLRADLDHIAIECKDVQKLLTFYTETIKFAPSGIKEYEQGIRPFPSARVSEVTIIDFFKSDDAHGLSGSGHFCFSIDKSAIADLKKRLETVSIIVDDPVPRSGARGDGMSIYFRDPEGNMLEFRYYE